jgi:putative transposase
VIQSNVDKYPVSAQCRILGVSKSTYYYLRANPRAPKKPDPLTQDVIDVYTDNRREYGARKIKMALSRRGLDASRKRIIRIMKENNLVSAYTKVKYKPSSYKVNEADIPNILNRNFNGYRPHSHLVGDLTYVRVGGTWNYVCLLIDLYNREIVGHAAAKHKDANLVKAAFATLPFSLFDIDIFHSDRGSEFDNMAIDEILEVFRVERSLSRKGNPYDNAVIESTNRILKKELIYQRTFTDLYDLQLQLNDYVHWYNTKRLHGTLDYLSPVEFRESGLVLEKLSK